MPSKSADSKKETAKKTADDKPPELVAEFAELKAEEKLCEGCQGTECGKKDKWRTNYRFQKEHLADWDTEGRWLIYSDECPHMVKSRKKARLQEQVLKSGLVMRYVEREFKDYEETADNSQAVTLAKWYVANKPNKSLYLYGGVGTGKTFLATLIAKEYVLENKSVVFGDVPKLLGRIKATFNGVGSAEDVIEHYQACDLLILDDVGAGQITDWSASIIYTVINDRYNSNKPLIITSNFNFRDLQRRLSLTDNQGNIVDDFSAKRIISRLSEMCIQGFLGTNDRRRKS